MHPFVDGGLQNVWLSNGYRVKQTRNGRSIVVHNPQGLKRTICSALCVKSVPLSGVEFQYLCRALELPAAVLSKRLCVTESQLVQWESATHVPRQADMFIRIMFAVHLDRPEPVHRLQAEVRSLDQKVYFVLHHSDKGWLIRETLDQPVASGATIRSNDSDTTLATDMDSLA